MLKRRCPGRNIGRIFGLLKEKWKLLYFNRVYVGVNVGMTDKKMEATRYQTTIRSVMTKQVRLLKSWSPESWLSSSIRP